MVSTTTALTLFEEHEVDSSGSGAVKNTHRRSWRDWQRVTRGRIGKSEGTENAMDPFLIDLNIRRTWLAATRDQWSRAVEGKNSYRYIRSCCSKMSSVRSLHQCVAVTAVISPIITWEENLIEARELCSGNWQYPFHALPLNIRKAQLILCGESVVDVLRGSKVWNFYWSILYPDNPFSVCVDRHVARAAFGWEFGWRAAIDTALKAPGVYNAISDGVRREAVVAGLTPLELQALLWLVVRENPFQARLF